VGAVGKTDHKAIVAYCELAVPLQRKETFQYTFRRKSPAINATFLEYISVMDPDTLSPTADTVDPQSEYDKFYSVALELLNRFYPQRTITVTSRDPEFITGDIKSKLRRMNRLMRSGRVEEAEALAKLIGKCISRNNQSRLLHINGRTDAKNMWAAVRQITGSRRSTGQTAEVLNNHYAVISNDDCYIPPMKKTDSFPLRF